MLKIFLSSFLTAGLFAGSFSVAHAVVSATQTLEAGALIRGESHSAMYYYGVDGLRYVFPTQDVFSGWYDSNCPEGSTCPAVEPYEIQWLSDEELWNNADQHSHTATEWDLIWGSGTLEPGEQYTRYFHETGTWHYYSKNDDRNVFE